MKKDRNALKTAIGGLWLMTIMVSNVVVLLTTTEVNWLWFSLLIFAVFQLAMWLCIMFVGLPWEGVGGKMDQILVDASPD